MSIRLRLTLLYSIILALMLAIGGVALYVAVARTTLGSIAAQLADDTQQMIMADRYRPGAHDDDDHIGPFGNRAALFQTRDLDGNVLNGSPALGGRELPLSADGLTAVRAGNTWNEQATVDGARLLIFSRKLSGRGGAGVVVQAARPLNEYDQTLTTLEMALLGGGALGVLISFVAGWLLAGAALQPIDRITQTARAIGDERDFTRRVAYHGPSDEVGRLATTFNTMLTELHATYDQMAQALAAQRRFVGDASHELRTPLTTVRGNLELLRREPPIAPDDRRAVLADSIDETERLSRLANDLLVLARSDGGWQPVLGLVPVGPLLAEVQRQIAQISPERTIDVAVRGEPIACGNRDLLKQVLLSLIDNALKHAPTGPIEITAQCEAKQVAISVRDHGPGIARDTLPHIFERFYRGDSARTEGGAGLGLAIARSLVEAQRGTIGVESAPGAGTTFTVRLGISDQELAIRA